MSRRPSVSSDTEQPFQRSLLDLPAEIFSQILDSLDFEALKNLRLTGSQLSPLVTPLLFRTANLIFTKQSLSNLRAIARHPDLQQQVTVLYYEGDRLRDIDPLDVPGFDVEDYNWDDEETINFRAWQHFADGDRYAWEDDEGNHNNELKFTWKNYDVYRELCREQADLTKNRTDQKTITDAISRLPNLEKLYISMGQGLWTPSPYQKRHLEQAGVVPDGDSWMKRYQPLGVRQVMSILDPLLRRLKTGIPSTLQPPSQTSSLRELHLLHIDLHLLKALERWTPDDLSRVMGQLEEFRLYLRCLRGRYEKDHEIEIHDRWRTMLEKPTIRNLLTAAPNLRYFCVHLDECPVTVRPRILNSISGDNFTWAHLREFHLTYVRFQAEELISFVTRHMSSLRCVALDYPVLEGADDNDQTPPSWADFALQLRELNLPLEEFELRYGIWSCAKDSNRISSITTHDVPATDLAHTQDDDLMFLSDILEAPAQPAPLYWASPRDKFQKPVEHIQDYILGKSEPTTNPFDGASASHSWRYPYVGHWPWVERKPRSRSRRHWASRSSSSLRSWSEQGDADAHAGSDADLDVVGDADAPTRSILRLSDILDFRDFADGEGNGRESDYMTADEGLEPPQLPDPHSSTSFALRVREEEVAEDEDDDHDSLAGADRGRRRRRDSAAGSVEVVERWGV